jgi:hypothetical protein
MLIFSYKLERFIKKKILPKITIGPYKIVGSFKNKALYMTDVDLINNTYLENIPMTEMYKRLLSLLNPGCNIHFIYATCGFDERFQVNSIDDVSCLTPLLNEKEKENIQIILHQYQNEPDKSLFFINELLRDHYSLKWTENDIRKNYLELPGQKVIKFTDVLLQDIRIIMRYYIMVGTFPLGLDNGIYYLKTDLTDFFRKHKMRSYLHSYFLEEYYYMLMPLRSYFHHRNPDIYREINNIIEKKYGYYKQLMTVIEMYHKLASKNLLSFQTAKMIIIGIINDLTKKDDLMNFVKKIKECTHINDQKEKMKEWGNTLSIMYEKVNNQLSKNCKDDYYYYLSLVPKEDKCSYFLK